MAFFILNLRSGGGSEICLRRMFSVNSYIRLLLSYQHVKAYVNYELYSKQKKQVKIARIGVEIRENSGIIDVMGYVSILHVNWQRMCDAPAGWHRCVAV